MNLLYEETMARIKTVSRTQTQTELAKLLEVSQSSVAEARDGNPSRRTGT